MKPRKLARKVTVDGSRAIEQQLIVSLTERVKDLEISQDAIIRLLIKKKVVSEADLEKEMDESTDRIENGPKRLIEECQKLMLEYDKPKGKPS